MPCPLCGKEHPQGKCPKGIAQLQLNQQIYLKELNQPVRMAQTLRDFLQEVFKNNEIMHPKCNPALTAEHRSRLIYNLYTSTGKLKTGIVETEVEKQFFKAIGWTASRFGFQHNAFFQNSNPRKSLTEVVEELNQGKAISDDLYSDFLYFSRVGPGDIKIRLYLNVHLRYNPNMVNLIGDYIKKNGNFHGIVDFKLAGPREAPDRADTMVIYCTGEDEARKLGGELLKHPENFGKNIPKMTTRIHELLGAAIGAEPKWQGTGMNFDEGTYKTYLHHYGETKARNIGETAQSFGTIRSQLIAMAIENYLDNRMYIHGASEFEKYCKFVCAAFRGYGLDPLNPGN